jgi:hypothetical protein
MPYPPFTVHRSPFAVRRSPMLQFFPAKDCTVIETDATHRKRIRLAAIAQPCILPQTL